MLFNGILHIFISHVQLKKSQHDKTNRHIKNKNIKVEIATKGLVFLINFAKEWLVNYVLYKIIRSWSFRIYSIIVLTMKNINKN